MGRFRGVSACFGLDENERVHLGGDAPLAPYDTSRQLTRFSLVTLPTLNTAECSRP